MSDHEYEVEALVGKRMRKGQVQYLVKWKGWDRPEDNSWKSLDGLGGCRDLVEDYEARNQIKKKHGFDRGLTAEKIIGATRDPGVLFLLVKVSQAQVLGNGSVTSLDLSLDPSPKYLIPDLFQTSSSPEENLPTQI